MQAAGLVEKRTTKVMLCLLLMAALVFSYTCSRKSTDVGSNCDDVVCDDPPPSRCETDEIVREYQSPGTCIEGECEYEFEEHSCLYGCDDETGTCRICLDECEEGETECTDGEIRVCEMEDGGCTAWSDFVPCEDGLCADDGTCLVCDDQPCGEVDGCCPFGCTHENDPDCDPPTDEELTTWVLLVSDLHFGGTTTIYEDFLYFLDVVLPTVDPVSVINTGDTVELGSSIPDWQNYFSSIDGRVPPAPHYFEVPGNHDVKQTDETNYLSFTQAGLSDYGMHGQTFIDGRNNPNIGRLRVLRTNTADSNYNALNVPGIFGEEQADELMALSPGDDPISYTLVAAHHPLTGIQRLVTGLGRMRNLVTHVGANIYLCGHAHIPRLSWYENTLVVQAVSLGKTNPPGFSLVSMDVSGPSAQMIDMTPRVTWPIVMITGPADPDLGDGNPYAVSFPPGGELPVRAIAFDTAGIDSVEARLDQDDWTTMTHWENNVWSTSLDLPTTSGNHSLEVRAIGGSGNQSQSMRVSVAP